MNQHGTPDDWIAEEVPPEPAGLPVQPHAPPRGPRLHDVLGDDQLRRISRLAVVLDEAVPLTLDCWIDAFCRSAAPESEIALIEAVAVVYTKLASRSDLGVAEKKMLYATIVATTTETNMSVLQERLPAVFAESVGISGICAMLADAVSQRERP